MPPPGLQGHTLYRLITNFSLNQRVEDMPCGPGGVSAYIPRGGKVTI